MCPYVPAETASLYSGSDIDEGEDEMPETIAKLMDNEVPFAPSQYHHQQLARCRDSHFSTRFSYDFHATHALACTSAFKGIFLSSNPLGTTFHSYPEEHSRAHFPLFPLARSYHSSPSIDRNNDGAVSESCETSDASEQESKPESPKSLSVQGSSKSKSRSTSTALAHIVVAEGGNIKLLAQNLETQRVVKGAIMEAKCQLAFVDGFPELHNLCEIEKHHRMDEDYISQLASLVDARIPILRRELKDDACTKVSGYFHLGHIDVEKAKNLMVKHAYIYAMKPIISLHPYETSPIRSIGVRFAKHFADLAENNAKRPEVPIPLVALVVTAVFLSFPS
ncbi:hypothetical protein DFJ58DRAFT_735888 [Suillus subalutaceus]|uniref:uncharacterized protein n=1 Tax=Suillus subalutaceus TaxID=48586 RepID=UPI001B885ECE|nr:uncharacterized protein DFJ58DRAFT_735888 [Suillus subalutaceus]KAG1834078.1 hypothetical protein DFJ58DRAFT_735888 [Suillus subalutaceus]